MHDETAGADMTSLACRFQNPGWCTNDQPAALSSTLRKSEMPLDCLNMRPQIAPGDQTVIKAATPVLMS